MDPITALGVAGNIISFAQCAGKFATEALAIYRAGDDALDEVSNLRLVGEDLRKVLGRLDDQSKFSPDVNPSMRILCQECSKITTELLATLPKASRLHSKREAIVTAFKAQWDSHKISKLEERVSNVRDQLMFQLLIHMREQQTKILEEMKSIRYSSQSRAGEDKEDFESLGVAFMDEIVLELKPSDRDEVKKSLEEALKQIILSKAVYEGDQSPPGYEAQFTPPGLSEYHTRQLQSQFIACLRYNGIDDRKARIAEAHAKTYKWVFDESSGMPRRWHSFPSWLKSESGGLYWVTGKAGSGKSTLMKFMVGHETAGISDGPESNTCRQHLSNWAGNHQLIIASFFSWSSGSSFEASQLSLYRSLLYQIFQHAPDLILKGAPGHWEVLYLLNSPPRGLTEEELRSMLCSVIKVASTEYKLCLFIDGLDEFNGQRDKLLALLREFQTFDHVKLCVASRPETEFLEEFDGSPRLMLQDVNYKDIRNYVSSSFSNHEGFSRLQYREPDYANILVDKVAQKASGVFLWVSLVVRTLLAGLQNDDRIYDLEVKLDHLPPELHDFYDNMLKRTQDSKHPSYFEHAAQYFKLVETRSEVSWRSPTALFFAFTDDEESYALGDRPLNITEIDKQMKIDTLRRRINSRCRGLLEIVRGDAITPTLSDSGFLETPGSKSESGIETVQYLHKTVREYIQKPEVQAKFAAALKSFNPHLRLCAASLAMAKALTPSTSDLETPGTTEEWAFHIHRCLNHAHKTTGDQQRMFTLLDGMDTYLRQALPPVFDERHRAVFKPQRFHLRYGSGCFPGSISLAVRAGVYSYVNERVDMGALVLDVDTAPEISRVGSVSSRSSIISAVKTLSSRGSREEPATITPLVGWPLLLDALDPLPQPDCQPDEDVNSSARVAPNLKMAQFLLEKKNADPNFFLNDRGLTVWQSVVREVARECLRDLNVERWDEWAPVLRVLMAETNPNRRDWREIEGSLTGFDTGKVHALLVHLKRDGLQAAREEFLSTDFCTTVPLGRISNFGRRPETKGRR